jgi:hypothetical protein
MSNLQKLLRKKYYLINHKRKYERKKETDRYGIELWLIVVFLFVFTAFVSISVEVEKKNKERSIENSIEQPPFHPLTTTASKMVPVILRSKKDISTIFYLKLSVSSINF